MFRDYILEICLEHLDFCAVVDNRYALIRDIGESRFGKVYLAVDKVEKRLVALKRLKNISKTKVNLRMFLNEMKNLAKLQKLKRSSHVCSIYDFNLSGRYKDNQLIVYYIMEYKEMGDLFSLVQDIEDSLSQNLVGFFMCQIYKALAEIHSVGIVHLDLKLDNIVVDENLQIFLCDFGHSLDINGKMISQNRNPKKGFKKKRVEELIQVSFVGSLNYSAPEILDLQNQLECETNDTMKISEKLKAVDFFKCDVFSSGVVLFVQLLKLFPFNKAAADDEFFRVMIQKPSDFEKSFGNIRELDEKFLDLFYQSCGISVNKRLDVKGLLTHPWLQDNTYAHFEYAVEELYEFLDEKKRVFSEKLQSYLSNKRDARMSSFNSRARMGLDKDDRQEVSYRAVKKRQKNEDYFKIIEAFKTEYSYPIKKLGKDINCVNKRKNYFSENSFSQRSSSSDD